MMMINDWYEIMFKMSTYNIVQICSSSFIEIFNALGYIVHFYSITEIYKKFIEHFQYNMLFVFITLLYSHFKTILKGNSQKSNLGDRICIFGL